MSRRDADQWRELAARLRLEGRLADAVDASRRAVDESPADAEAWSELAHALRSLGKLDEAWQAATRAVEHGPRNPRAWFNLGAVLQGRGETAQSITAYRKALDLQPDYAEAWSNLGGALAAGGDKAGEIDAYRRALAIDPRLAPVWSNLGNALHDAGQLEEALSACRRAVELDPEFGAAWNNLGNTLRERGEHEQALAACERALQLSPQLAETWSTFGAALHAVGRYDEAIRAHRRASEIQPGSALHYFNLGVLFQHCGRNPDAIANFRRALEITPDDAQARSDLSLALLATGQLREGWEEYEWRWRRRGAAAKRHDLAPWNGDVSEPRRLLLWAEQGVGDQILYGSMIADLVSSPMSIALEVDPRLVPLYQRSFPQVFVAPDLKPPAVDPAAHDCQAPLGSLGRWLRRSFESFPRHRGYLIPEPSRAEAYRKRLLRGRSEEGPIIGVSWKSENKELGPFKTSALRDWLGVVRTPRARFVDLQYGDTADERRLLEQQAGVRIEHLADLDLYHDLEGLAALCAACDLIITVSNVTAHMAGALGRPVWVLVPRARGKIWYWFSERADSPWYPSARIFTQLTPGHWQDMLDSVAQELAALMTGVR